MLQAISPFFTIFSTAIYLCQNAALCGKGLDSLLSEHCLYVCVCVWGGVWVNAYFCMLPVSPHILTLLELIYDHISFELFSLDAVNCNGSRGLKKIT